MRAIGYHGIPVDDLPFDESHGVVPNADGRVLTAPDADPVPGVYVTGWIKRGATGGIGMNRLDGQYTARAVLDDYTRRALHQPRSPRERIAPLIAGRGANRIDADGWNRIDNAEKSAGRTQGRRRVKLVRIQDLEDAAAP
jgi:ferredoxin--NADP+ reductase